MASCIIDTIIEKLNIGDLVKNKPGIRKGIETIVLGGTRWKNVEMRIQREKLEASFGVTIGEGKLTESDKIQRFVLDKGLPFKVKGHKSLRYAGVGSRRTPENIINEMKKLGGELAEEGYTLLSGKADGADKAFEETAGAKKEIFTREHIANKTFGEDITKLAIEIMKAVHPSPDKLTKYQEELMARNAFQVLGPNLDSPVDFLIAWAPLNDKGEVVVDADGRFHGGKDDPRSTGGTGQAIALAAALGIPVINMADPNWREKLNSVLSGKNTGGFDEESRANRRGTRKEEPLTKVKDANGKDATVKIVKDIFNNDQYMRIKAFVANLLDQKDSEYADELRTNLKGSKAKDRQRSIVFGENGADKVPYKYAGTSHNPKEMPQELKDLARLAEELDGKPNGYYNHVLINYFAEGNGIGNHTDAESIYKDENGSYGSVSIFSIGKTKTNHSFGNNDDKVNAKVLDNSFSVMSTGNTYHSVGHADKGGRYSITFRHVPGNVIKQHGGTRSEVEVNDKPFYDDNNKRQPFRAEKQSQEQSVDQDQKEEQKADNERYSQPGSVQDNNTTYDKNDEKYKKIIEKAKADYHGTHGQEGRGRVLMREFYDIVKNLEKNFPGDPGKSHAYRDSWMEEFNKDMKRKEEEKRKELEKEKEHEEKQNDTNSKQGPGSNSKINDHEANGVEIKEPETDAGRKAKSTIEKAYDNPIYVANEKDKIEIFANPFLPKNSKKKVINKDIDQVVKSIKTYDDASVAFREWIVSGKVPEGYTGDKDKLQKRRIYILDHIDDILNADIVYSRTTTKDAKYSDSKALVDAAIHVKKNNNNNNNNISDNNNDTQDKASNDNNHSADNRNELFINKIYDKAKKYISSVISKKDNNEIFSEDTTVEGPGEAYSVDAGELVSKVEAQLLFDRMNSSFNLTTLASKYPSSFDEDLITIEDLILDINKKINIDNYKKATVEFAMLALDSIISDLKKEFDKNKNNDEKANEIRTILSEINEIIDSTQKEINKAQGKEPSTSNNNNNNTSNNQDNNENTNSEINGTFDITNIPSKYSIDANGTINVQQLGSGKKETIGNAELNAKENFGNPFNVEAENNKYSKPTTVGYFSAKTNEEASKQFLEWLLTGKLPQEINGKKLSGMLKENLRKRRKFILENIGLIKKYKSLKYNGTGADDKFNHAKVLANVAEFFDDIVDKLDNIDDVNIPVKKEIDRNSGRKKYHGNINALKDNEVFVFGSNEDGFHGAGSAGFASFGVSGNKHKEFGYSSKENGWKGKWNVKGIGEGYQEGTSGASYALPTKVKAAGKSRSKQDIVNSIVKLYEYADKNKDKDFLIAYSIPTDNKNKSLLSGFKPKEIADMFAKAIKIHGSYPENIVFEDKFFDYVNNNIDDKYKNNNTGEQDSTTGSSNKKTTDEKIEKIRDLAIETLDKILSDENTVVLEMSPEDTTNQLSKNTFYDFFSNMKKIISSDMSDDYEKGMIVSSILDLAGFGLVISNTAETISDPHAQDIANKIERLISTLSDKINKIYENGFNEDSNNNNDRYALQGGKFTANEDQKKLIDLGVEFLENDSDEISDNIFIVQGKGGTGKSTTIGRIIDLYAEEAVKKAEEAKGDSYFDRPKMIGAAFMHVAKDVLKDMTESMNKKNISGSSIYTLASLFYGSKISNKPTFNSDKSRRTFVDEMGVQLGPFSNIVKQIDNSMSRKIIFVIDEVSMLSSDDIKFIMAAQLYAKKNGKILKVFMLGDYHQLPPVNDKNNKLPIGKAMAPLLKYTDGRNVSKIKAFNDNDAAGQHFDNIKNTFELNKQERQKDGTLLFSYINNAAKHVEDMMRENGIVPTSDSSFDPSLPTMSNDETVGIIENEIDFLERARGDFKSNPAQTKIITYNNKNVVKYANVVRDLIFGQENAAKFPFIFGDEGSVSDTIILYDTLQELDTKHTNGRQYEIEKIVEPNSNRDRAIARNIKIPHGKNNFNISIIYKDGVELEEYYFKPLDGGHDYFIVRLPKGFFTELNKELTGASSNTNLESAYLDVLNRYVAIEGNVPDNRKYIKDSLSRIPQEEKTKIPELVPFYYSYAITSYKSQGQTIENVYFDPTASMGSKTNTPRGKLSNAQSMYTAMSRAKKKLFILGAIPQIIPNSGDQQTSSKQTNQSNNSQQDSTPGSNNQQQQEPGAQQDTKSTNSTKDDIKNLYDEKEGTVEVWSNAKNKYNGLSNFNAGPVTIQLRDENDNTYDVKFNTIEAAFHAKKAESLIAVAKAAKKKGIINDKEFNDIVSEANKKIVELEKSKTGYAAWKIGKSIPLDKLNGAKETWDKISSNRLEVVMRNHYYNNSNARDLLLSTGMKKITHNAKNKWKEEFPRILMEIRHDLRPGSINQQENQQENQQQQDEVNFTFYDTNSPLRGLSPFGAGPLSVSFPDGNGGSRVYKFDTLEAAFQAKKAAYLAMKAKEVFNDPEATEEAKENAKIAYESARKIFAFLENITKDFVSKQQDARNNNIKHTGEYAHFIGSQLQFRLIPGSAKEFNDNHAAKVMYLLYKNYMTGSDKKSKAVRKLLTKETIENGKKIELKNNTPIEGHYGLVAKVLNKLRDDLLKDNNTNNSQESKHGKKLETNQETEKENKTILDDILDFSAKIHDEEDSGNNANNERNKEPETQKNTTDANNNSIDLNPYGETPVGIQNTIEELHDDGKTIQSVMLMNDTASIVLKNKDGELEHYIYDLNDAPSTEDATRNDLEHRSIIGFFIKNNLKNSNEYHEFINNAKKEQKENKEAEENTSQKEINTIEKAEEQDDDIKENTDITEDNIKEDTTDNTDNNIEQEQEPESNTDENNTNEDNKNKEFLDDILSLSEDDVKTLFTRYKAGTKPDSIIKYDYENGILSIEFKKNSGEIGKIKIAINNEKQNEKVNYKFDALIYESAGKPIVNLLFSTIKKMIDDGFIPKDKIPNIDNSNKETNTKQSNEEKYGVDESAEEETSSDKFFREIESGKDDIETIDDANDIIETIANYSHDINEYERNIIDEILSNIANKYKDEYSKYTKEKIDTLYNLVNKSKNKEIASMLDVMLEYALEDNDNIKNQSTNQSKENSFDRRLNKKIKRLLIELYPNIILKYERDKQLNRRGSADLGAGVVLINTMLAKTDTLPHEYAHHYIHWFRNEPVVKNAIKSYGSEEALVQAIGEEVVNRKGKAYRWWEKFTQWLRNIFNKNIDNKTKEELKNEITRYFLEAKNPGTREKIDIKIKTEENNNDSNENVNIDETLTEYEKRLKNSILKNVDFNNIVTTYGKENIFTAIEQLKNGTPLVNENIATIYIELLAETSYVQNAIEKRMKKEKIGHNDAKKLLASEVASIMNKNIILHDESFIIRLYEKIVKTLRSIFKIIPEKDVDMIALNIENQILSDAILFDHKPGTKKVDPWYDFSNQPEVDNLLGIVSRVMNDDAVFTGSEVLAIAGDIYRKQGEKGTDLHDVDVEISEEGMRKKGKLLEELRKEYNVNRIYDFGVPVNEKLVKIAESLSDNAFHITRFAKIVMKAVDLKLIKSNRFSTYIVTPKNVEVINIERTNGIIGRVYSYDLYDTSKKEIVGTYRAEYRALNAFKTEITKEEYTGEKAILLDLLENKKYFEKEHKTTWTTPKGNEIYISVPYAIFRAKNAISTITPRTKDVFDVNDFYSTNNNKKYNEVKKEFIGKTIVSHEGTGKTLTSKLNKDVVDVDTIISDISGSSIENNEKSLKNKNILDKVKERISELNNSGKTVLIDSKYKKLYDIADIFLFQKDPTTINRYSNTDKSVSQIRKSIEKYYNIIKNKQNVIKLKSLQFVADIILEEDVSQESNTKNNTESIQHKDDTIQLSSKTKELLSKVKDKC